MAEGYLYDRGDELIERKDLSESLVPEIDPDTDEGKILTVDSEGKATWDTPESDLPAITPTTDQGKVLTVGDDDEAEWSTPEGTLPAITPTTDQGKVLAVGDDDEPEWSSPAGVQIIRLTFPSVENLSGWVEINLQFPAGMTRADIVTFIENGGLFSLVPDSSSVGIDNCGIIVKPVIHEGTIFLPGHFIIGFRSKVINTKGFSQIVVSTGDIMCTSTATNFKVNASIVTSVLAQDDTTVYPST